MDHIDVAMAITVQHRTDRSLILKKAAHYRERRDRYAETPWEIPGGKLHEDDDDLAAAALRELAEETGLTGRVVREGESYTDRQTAADGTPMEITFHPVLIEVTETDTSLSEEHETYAWITPRERKDYLTNTELQAYDTVIPEPVHVATAVTYNPNIDACLLVKRDTDHEPFGGRWEFPAGSIEPGEHPEKTASRELYEETGLHGRIDRVGCPFLIRAASGTFKVHPVRIHTGGQPILSREHTDWRWMPVEDVPSMDTVPDLEQDLVATGLTTEETA